MEKGYFHTLVISKTVSYIIDWQAQNQVGRIVAMERNGRLKFTYCGPTNFEFFQPLSIVVNPSDNVVICGTFNNALLALNSNGYLIALQFVHEMNILETNALCIDSEGFLLTGCSENEGESGKKSRSKDRGNYLMTPLDLHFVQHIYDQVAKTKRTCKS